MHTAPSGLHTGRRFHFRAARLRAGGLLYELTGTRHRGI
jgi:hypothetical protein